MTPEGCPARKKGETFAGTDYPEEVPSTAGLACPAAVCGARSWLRALAEQGRRPTAMDAVTHELAHRSVSKAP
jgi:hypothetical protein